MSKLTPIPADELARLLALRDATAEALRPNGNALGDWKAKPHGSGPEWVVCGPVHGCRPSRPILAVTEMDGFTPEESHRNNRAVAEFIVAAVNRALAGCREAKRAGKGKVTP